jgi:protein SCO1/2
VKKAAAAIVVAIAAAAAALPAAARPASIGGAFSLTQAPGRTVHDTDFHGKYLLVFFGYTGCPDICPDTLYKIAQALRLMGRLSTQVQAVFITVDPLRDTPAIMANYAALFSPGIIGLSGSASQIAAVERDYHVYAGPRDPVTGAIAHSAILYIMRPDGTFASALPDNVTAAALADSLTKLTSAH